MMTDKLYEDVPLPFEPVFTNHEPPNPHFESREGIRIWCLGFEGETLVSFQDVEPATFIAACEKYELSVEAYESEEPYSLDQVKHRQVAFRWTSYPDEWSLSWADDEPVKDVLVTMLERW